MGFGTKEDNKVMPTAEDHAAADVLMLELINGRAPELFRAPGTRSERTVAKLTALFALSALCSCPLPRAACRAWPHRCLTLAAQAFASHRTSV